MKMSFMFAMIRIVLGSGGVLLLALVGKAESKTVPAAQQRTSFFCDRLAISAEHRKRHEELSRTLALAKLGVREMAEGFEFEFPNDPATYRDIMEWIPDERACCPFFDITVHLEREQGKIWLGFSGAQGIKTFIKAEFAPWFRP